MTTTTTTTIAREYGYTLWLRLARIDGPSGANRA